MGKISQDDLALLNSVVAKRKPDCLPLAATIGKVPLTHEGRQEIQQVMLDEMYDKGLEQDDEPNIYGRQLSEIISNLEQY